MSTILHKHRNVTVETFFPQEDLFWQQQYQQDKKSGEPYYFLLRIYSDPELSVMYTKRHINKNFTIDIKVTLTLEIKDFL